MSFSFLAIAHDCYFFVSFPLAYPLRFSTASACLGSANNDDKRQRRVLMNTALAMVEPTNDGVLEDLSKAVIRDGEKRLMLAVLESATEDFQKYVLANHKRGKELFQAAEEWILDTDDSSFFSFANICEHLNLNPGYMRQGFMRWKAAKLNGHAQECVKRSNRRVA
jgi:hypothetical protein